MASARRFLYTIQAEYAGESEIKKLSADLQKVGKIKAFEKQQASVQKLEKSLEEATKRQEDFRKKLESGGGKTVQKQYEAAGRAVAKYTESLEKQNKKLAEQKAVLASVGVATNDLANERKKAEVAARKQGETAARYAKLGIRSSREIKTEIQGLSKAYKDLERSGVASTKELSRAKSNLQKKTKELNQELKGISGKATFSKMLPGITAATAAVAALGAALRVAGASIKTFAEFDDTMRQVGAVSGATKQEFQALTETAKEMGRTTRFTARESSEALKFMGMAGFNATTQLETLPTVLNLAAAGATDLGQTSNIVTNIMTGFGIEARNLESTSDILTRTFTSSNSSLTSLGYAFSYVAPQAKAAGLEFAETAAILGQFHNAGIQGTRAGTALRAGLARLQVPTRRVKNAMKELGVDTHDSSGEARNLIDVMRDLEKAAPTATQMTEIFGKVAGPGMTKMLQDGMDSLDEYKEKLENGALTTSSVAEDMEAGLGGSFRSMKSAIEGLGIELGEKLAPVMEIVASLITDLARNIEDFSTAGIIAVEIVRALHNAFAGIVFVVDSLKVGVHGIIATLAEISSNLFPDFARKILKPFDLIFKGMEKLNLIDINPFDALQQNLDDFAVSSKEVLSNEFKDLGENIDAMAKSNAMYDAAISKLKKKKEIIEKTEPLSEDDRQILNTFDEIKEKWEKVQNKKVKASRDAARETTAAAVKAKDAEIKAAEDVETAKINSAKKAASVQISETEKALSSARKSYDELIKAAEGYRQSATGRETSGAEQLREMARSGMTAEAAWRDMKRQADEYQAAAQAASKAGQFDEAITLADKAKNSYAQLNAEVKKAGDSDEIAITKKEGLAEAMKGVEESNILAAQAERERAKELDLEAKKEKEKAAALESSLQAQQESLENIGMKTKELSKDTEELQGAVEGVDEKWKDVFETVHEQGSDAADGIMEDVQELGRELDKIISQLDTAKSKSVSISVRPGGVTQSFDSGGRVPGMYPGRDNTLAMIASEEGIIPAAGMRNLDTIYGKGFFDYGLKNAGNSRGLAYIRASMPTLKSRPPAKKNNLRPIVLPALYGGVTVHADPQSVAGIMAAIKKEERKNSRFGQK